MNRRDFTKSLMALGLAPSLPASAMAVPAPAGYTPYMYGLGAHLARSSGRISPAILMQKLRLGSEAAHAMQAQMFRNGVVTASNAAGLARAVQPYMISLPGTAAALGGSSAAPKKVAETAALSDANAPDVSPENAPEDAEDQPTPNRDSKSESVPASSGASSAAHD